MNILDLWNNRIELQRGGQERREDFIKSLNAQVVWQDEAKKVVADALFKSINSIVSKRGPIWVFLFAWPSWVGKTEMAHALARELLGNSEHLTKINCESFSQWHSVSNLMGSAKGYVWYGQETPFHQIYAPYIIADKEQTISPLVRRFQWFNIIVFDEIEKAHPVIHQALLGIFDHGKTTLGDWFEVDFSTSIIIMTTNMGEREIREIGERPTMGFVAQDNTNDKEKAFKQALNQFSPEFRGRIDNVVHFEQLTKDDCLCILRNRLVFLNKAMEHASTINATTQISLGISGEVFHHLIELGYNPAVWARDLVRVFDKEINAPLGEIIFNNDELLQYPDHRALIIAQMKGEEIIFTLSKKDVKSVVNKTKATVHRLTDY